MSDGGEPTTSSGSYRARAIIGALWLSSGRLAKAGLNVVVIAVLSRLLPPADFGLAAAALMVTTLGAVLTDGTFGMSLIQASEISPEDVGGALFLSVGLGVLLAVGVVVCAPVIELAFGFQGLVPLLLGVVVVLPLGGVAAVGTALMQRRGQFKHQALVMTVARVAYGVTAIGLALRGAGVWSLLISQVVNSAVLAAAFAWLGLRGSGAVLTRRGLSLQLRVGGMFTATKLLKFGSGNIDRVIVGRQLGADSLGLYTRCIALLLTVNEIIGTGATRVLFSTFSRMQDEPERLARAVMRTLTAAMLVSSAASCFVILFADAIVFVLLGPDWVGAIPVLRWLFTALVARACWVTTESVPLSLGFNGGNAARNVLLLLLVILGAAVGSTFGIDRAAAGVAAAFWVFYLISLQWVTRLLPVDPTEVVLLHLKVVALFAGIAAIVALTTSLLGGVPEPFATSIRVVVFGVLVSAVFFGAPASIIGTDAHDLRIRALARIRRMLGQ